MAFHQDFWVVAGAATPITALANQVALGESPGLVWALFERRLSYKRRVLAAKRWELRRLQGLEQATEEPATEEPATEEPETDMGFLLPWLRAIPIISGANLIAQATVLLLALLSLSWNSNALPPAVAIVITFAGLLALFGTTWLEGNLRGAIAML
jgi:hypothetical protein